MSGAKIAIISSVPENPFSQLNFMNLGFTKSEIIAALTDEKQLFLDPCNRKFNHNGIDFHIIRATHGLPQPGEYDAYILGGSPHMVENRIENERIENYIQFVRQETNNNKPILGICFGHQVLSAANGGIIATNPSGPALGEYNISLNQLGKSDRLFRNIKPYFPTLRSHKQQVIDSGSGIVLGGSEHNPMGIISYRDNAWGVQFHPEFTPDTVRFLNKHIQEPLSDPQNNYNQGSNIIPEFIRLYYNR